MTKFELTEFLTWMTNHQPSSKQVMDEMYVHDVALVMQTVLAEIMQLRKERDEARRQVCDWYNTDESGCVKSGSHETARARGWDCFKETP